MKKLFMIALAAVFSLGASAQLVSSNTITHTKGNGYNRLSVSYDSWSKFEKGFDGASGVSAAWTKGISVSQSAPLFIETGLGLNYAWGEILDEIDLSWLSLTVPINLTYKYEIPNSGITIAPYAGLFLRGNIIGNLSSDYLNDDINLFDDYSDGGAEASRFSWGWNIGVGVEFSKLYVGVNYSNDFNEFIEDADKLSKFSATVGFNF